MATLTFGAGPPGGRELMVLTEAIGSGAGRTTGYWTTDYRSPLARLKGLREGILARLRQGFADGVAIGNGASDNAADRFDLGLADGGARWQHNDARRQSLRLRQQQFRMGKMRTIRLHLVAARPEIPPGQHVLR